MQVYERGSHDLGAATHRHADRQPVAANNGGEERAKVVPIEERLRRLLRAACADDHAVPEVTQLLEGIVRARGWGGGGERFWTQCLGTIGTEKCCKINGMASTGEI